MRPSHSDDPYDLQPLLEADSASLTQQQYGVPKETVELQRKANQVTSLSKHPRYFTLSRKGITTYISG